MFSRNFSACETNIHNNNNNNDDKEHTSFGSKHSDAANCNAHHHPIMDSARVELRLPPVDRRRPPMSLAPSAAPAQSTNKRSSVINLDKNRIRHARRLMPRPLSLPSGFQLMRQLANQRLDEDETPATIDIAVIQQLEDDIYNRRRSSPKARKRCRKGADCSTCNVITSKPNEASVAFQAIRLLDAWQMDPLLLKYAKAPVVNCIQNESKVDPTLTTPDTPDDHIPSPRPAPEPPTTDLHRRRSNLFQRCLSGSPTTDTEEDDHEATDDYPIDPANVMRPPSPIRKASKFKRFIMHRRSLNLSAASRADAEPNQPNPAPTPSPPVTETADIGHVEQHLPHADASQSQSTLTPKPPPLQSAHHINSSAQSKPLPAAPSSVASLRRRQWKSDDDMYETTHRDEANHQHDIGAELVDLERMQRQLDRLSVDLARRKQQLLLGGGSDAASGERLKAPHQLAAAKRRSPSMLMLFNGSQKRHSIGSPTDVVKTWVYRRRYIDMMETY